MAALPISHDQRVRLSLLDAALNTALADGVDDATQAPHPFLAPVTGYKDRLTSDQKVMVRSTFELVQAASMVVPAALNFRQVSVTGPVLNTDVYVVVVANPLAVTLTLPLANTVPPGHIFFFKDGSGTAATKNIGIVRSGGDTIDGAASTTLNANWAKAAILCDGVSAYWILG